MRRLALIVLVVLACRPEAGRQGDFALVVAAPGALLPLRPDISTSFATAAADLVFQAALGVDDDGQIRPRLASRWERLGPGRYRLLLDPGARFSDGSPVTMEDAARSLAAAGIRSQARGEWLEVEPADGRSSLDASLLFANVFRETRDGFLGTGPFALVRGDASRILLRRVSPAPGRIASVEIRGYPTAREAFARALRGEANAVLGLVDRQAELLDGVPRLRIVRGPGPHALGIFLNGRRLDVSPARVAGALRPDEVARAYGGGCRHPSQAWSPLPPGKAVDVVTAPLEPGLRRAALAARRSLGARGGEAVFLDPKEMGSALKRGDFQVLVSPFLAWPPALLGLHFRSGARWNWTGYSSGRVDRLLDAGEHATAWEELERDAPVVLVCRRERLAAVDARIRNATLGRFGLLETLPGWEVGP